MAPRRLSAIAVALVALSIAVFGTAGAALGWQRPDGSRFHPDPASGHAEQHGVLVPAAIIAVTDVDLRTRAPRPAERGRMLAGVHLGLHPSLQRTKGLALTPSGDLGSSIPLAVAPSRSPPSSLLS
jgi:hypothetical protein